MELISKEMRKFLAEMGAYSYYCGYSSKLAWMDAYHALEQTLGVRPTASQIKKYLFDRADLRIARGRITQYFEAQRQFGDGRTDAGREQIVFSILQEIETDISGRLLAEEIDDLKRLGGGSPRFPASS